MEENRDGALHFQVLQVYDKEEYKKSISSVAESVESGEIYSSSSEWKTDLDERFATC